MGNPVTAESAASLRMLPSVDDLLQSDTAGNLIAEIGRRRYTSMARSVIAGLRNELTGGTSSKNKVETKESLLAEADSRLRDLWQKARASRFRDVINATGVIVHTNLGRAPLSDEAIDAIRSAAGYCTLEYDLATGKRGKRGQSVEELLVEVTGAEAALVVNNCAAAAFAVLSVFAHGGDVIVSRGELVEIGGDFRIPDVLIQSGATLREVGTTNRTKLSDYEKAIGERTKLVMRVHPSNYKIIGFTESPPLLEMAELAHRKGVPLYEDAGSGALLDLSKFGLTDEPVIARSIADGADLVTFSGDKLLGGAQAGIVIGKRGLIEQIRKHPLYRALRVDKLIYAALQATLEAYVRDDAEARVPVLQMLAMSRETIEARATNLVERLTKICASEIGFEIRDGKSVVGGGSSPGVGLETAVVAIKSSKLSCDEIDERLRGADAPVIGRIEDDAFLLDLRTVPERQEGRLIEMIAAALA